MREQKKKKKKKKQKKQFTAEAQSVLQILISKHEIRNNFKALNSNVQNKQGR